MFSLGVPMISGGDEIGRTQGGNNNAYCQDNETSWHDWNLRPEQQRLLEFVRGLAEIRREQPVLRRRGFFEDRSSSKVGPKDVQWLHPDGREMTDADWHAPTLRTMGVLLMAGAIDEVDSRGRAVPGDTLLLLVNGHSAARSVRVPRAEDGARWERLLDTTLEEPAAVRHRMVKPDERYRMAGHSLALFRSVPAAAPVARTTVRAAPPNPQRQRETDPSPPEEAG